MQTRDCRQRDSRGALANHNARKRGEHEPFDQAGSSRGFSCSGAKRLMDAGHDAAWNEQRAQLDVDGADKGAYDCRRKDKPCGAVPREDRVVPAMKNAATPSCATASAAALAPT